MPYYRILIWTKQRRKPFCGIRQIDAHNINAVFQMVYKKAETKFMSNLIDVEVQMLPKMSTVIQRFIRATQQRNGLK